MLLQKYHVSDDLFESYICMEWVSLGRLILLWQPTVMWREIKKKSTYQHWISSGSRMKKILMQCHCIIFYYARVKNAEDMKQLSETEEKPSTSSFFNICSEACIPISNLTPTLSPGWSMDISCNPNLHTGLLYNLALTLKNKYCKILFWGKIQFFAYLPKILSTIKENFSSKTFYLQCYWCLKK